MSHTNTLLEVLVISAAMPEDGSEASIEQFPEIQSPTTSLFSEGVAINNTLDEKSHNDNDLTMTTIVAPTEDSALQEPVDNSVNIGLAEDPQAIAEEQAEAGELVEDTASGRGERENNEDERKICN